MANKDEFSIELPDEIKVTDSLKKKKEGRPPSHVTRRKKKLNKDKDDTGRVSGNAGWYSDSEKLDAACRFAVVGNSRRVSELTGIPEGTIRAWKTTDWWQEIQERIVKEQDEELDTKLTKLVDKAVEEVNDRLLKGDYVYNPKADKLIRKPINAKDLSIVMAVTVDKRQLMRGKPTSRIEKIGQSEQLKQLAAEFRKMAEMKDITLEAEVIDHA